MAWLLGEEAFAALMEALDFSDVYEEIINIDLVEGLESIRPARAPTVVESIKGVLAGAGMVGLEPILDDIGEHIYNTYVNSPEEKDVSPDAVEHFSRAEGKMKPKRLSFDNLPDEEQMPGRRMIPYQQNMVGKAGGPRTGRQMMAEDDEAPVVPPPAKVSKIVNDYFTISMPVHHHRRVALTYPAGTIVSEFINLNTCNTPIGGTTNDYRGRNTWAAMFQYYRVLKTDVRLTWYASNVNMYVGWSLHEDTSHANWTTRRDMCESKHAGYDLLDCHTPNASGGILPLENTMSGTKNRVIQQYSYTPESWDHHVSKFGDEERWTSIGASPVVPRYMHFGAISCYTTEYTSGAPFVHVDVDILVTVQFREAFESILHNEIDNTEDTNN